MPAKILVLLMGLAAAACATDQVNQSGGPAFDQPEPCRTENVQQCLQEALRKSRSRTTLTPAQEQQLLQQQQMLIDKTLGGEVAVTKPKEPVLPEAENDESTNLKNVIPALPPASQEIPEMPQPPEQTVVPEMPASP